MNANRKLKGHIKTAIKFTVVAVLIFFLAKRGFISWSATKQAFDHPGLLVLTCLTCFLATTIATVRWHFLMKGHEIDLTLWRTFYMMYIGQFFNNALPGAVSGDLIKALYIGREVPQKRAKAFGSIIFDRIVGVSALVLVSASSLLLSIGNDWNGNLFRSIEVFVLVAGACVIAFFAYLFLMPVNRDPLLLIFEWTQSRAHWFGSITRTYAGIRDYGQKRKLVAFSMVLSLIVHVLVVIAFVILANTMGGADVPPLAIGTVVPLGMLIIAIPIATAGIGTGHAAFLWLFLQIGFKHGADLFTLYVLYKLIEGAVGGLLYLRFRSKDPAIAMSAANESR